MAKSTAVIGSVTDFRDFGLGLWWTNAASARFDASVMAGSAQGRLVSGLLQADAASGMRFTVTPDFSDAVRTGGSLAFSVAGAEDFTLSFADASRETTGFGSNVEYRWGSIWTAFNTWFNTVPNSTTTSFSITVSDLPDPLEAGADPLAAAASLGNVGGKLGPLPPRESAPEFAWATTPTGATDGTAVAGYTDLLFTLGDGEAPGPLFAAGVAAAMTSLHLRDDRTGGAMNANLAVAADMTAAFLEHGGVLVRKGASEVALRTPATDATRGSDGFYRWNLPGSQRQALAALRLVDGPWAIVFHTGSAGFAPRANLSDVGAVFGPTSLMAGTEGFAAAASLSEAGAYFQPVFAGASALAASVELSNVGAELGAASLLAGADALEARASLSNVGAELGIASLVAGADALGATARLSNVGGRVTGDEFLLRLGQQFWLKLSDVDATTRNTLVSQSGEALGATVAVDGGTFVPSQGVLYGRATRAGVYNLNLVRTDPETDAVVSELPVQITVTEPPDPLSWRDDVRFALFVPADGEAPAWRWWTGEYEAVLEGETFAAEVLVDADVGAGIDRGFTLLFGPPVDTVEEAWLQTYRDLRPCELWLLRRVADSAGTWQRRRRIAGVLSAVVDNRSGTFTGTVERQDDPGARNADFGGEYISDESQKRLHDPEDECMENVELIGTEGVEGIWPQPPAAV